LLVFSTLYQGADATVRDPAKRYPPRGIVKKGKKGHFMGEEAITGGERAPKGDQRESDFSSAGGNSDESIWKKEVFPGEHQGWH